MAISHWRIDSRSTLYVCIVHYLAMPSMSGHIRNAIENTVTVLVLLAVAAVTGYFGLVGAISDRGPGESVFDRNSVVLGFAISGALLIGFFCRGFGIFQ